MKQKAVTSTYIHIPFCSQICYYCDFSKVLIDYQPVTSYLDALLREIEQADMPAQRTLYIGGGTPTALKANQLRYLLEGIEERVDLSKLEEYTIEANPNDLTDEIVEVIKRSKINRVSIGVQTFNPKLLKKIGRSHSQEDIFAGINRLQKAGLTNLSIDLIYALPTQTLADLKETLTLALQLELPHYSIYSLILESQTVFMNQYKQGRLLLPDSQLEFEMYELIRQTLQESGLIHYEVSNFGKLGSESRHNLVYWNNEEYFGFGAGASGYLNGVRYKNHGPIKHYLTAQTTGLLRVSEEALSQKEIMEEEMFLGLRKACGVSLLRFEEKFGVDFFEIYGDIARELEQKQLLDLSDGNVKMTSKGLLQGNDVFAAFI
ncbi:MAG: radical SAM family heme chaperone HemW [Streptococcaceae bacterium]|jgi:oxygen-independent coproporphyrinogen-3 oxidase|nr:radical SAM family heme chaperone HemW [Streptococcaceae bacterium]